MMIPHTRRLTVLAWLEAGLFGTPVRLSARHKKFLAKDVNGRKHLREFGKARGHIEGFARGPKNEVWPELDVRWDSGLRYSYQMRMLEVIPLCETIQSPKLRRKR